MPCPIDGDGDIMLGDVGLANVGDATTTAVIDILVPTERGLESVGDPGARLPLLARLPKMGDAGVRNGERSPDALAGNPSASPKPRPCVGRWSCRPRACAL